MLALSTLTLFPSYSLDTSILVAVLAGVLILALLTETLGWVFVGLVVPGYLASLFVIHPEAGATVVVESILTYLLALALSQGVSRTGAWSSFFGRDRFFAIVLASVLVRALSEALLLPVVGRWLDARLGTTFALDRTLHSIGLVLVPLTANAFWKLQLRRGLWQVGVPVALTYALLQWVLLPNTNLSFSSLELMYEDIAQNFLASPKAYILLLTTALLAARFNLRYGWDFNGILVPALLALTWLTPLKLVTTLAEALLLVLGTKALLSVPGLKTLNLEGPRKTVLVFTLGFVVKWCIGWAFAGRLPGLKVTDLFGFGYLVPTLLAVKMLQKQVVARVMLATVHTSLAGFLVGSLIGFGLSLVEPRAAIATPGQRPPVEAPALELARSPLGAMALARATARESGSPELPLGRKRGELRRYGLLWRAVDRWLETAAPADLDAVRVLALPLGLEVHRLATSWPGAPEAYVLLERGGVGDRVGWDTAVLVPGAPGPVLEVPRPLSEAPGAEAAAVLCERVRCRALLASGVDSRLAGLLQGDALLEEHTPLQRAHAALDGRERLQVRADASLPRGRPTLHLAEEAPTSVAVEALWPEAQRTTEPPPEPGVAWGEARLSVLRAHPEDLLALVAAHVSVEFGPPLEVEELLSTLQASGVGAELAGTLPPPSSAELLLLQQQVAAPLLTSGEAEVSSEARLRWAAAMAGLLDLQLRPVRGCGGTGPCWLVVESGATRGRLGAGLLVHPAGAPLAIEAPTPVREPGTLPFALAVWRETGARALLFADAAAASGPEQPHPASVGHVHTPFQALHAALHRALPADAGLVLQVRGFSGRPHIAADVLVDLEGPVLEPSRPPAPLARLLSAEGPLAWLAPRVRYHDGSPELAGLSDALSPQQVYSRTFSGPRLATLWLSEPLRGAYVGPRQAETQLALAGFPPPPLEPLPPVPGLLTPGLRPPSRPVPPQLMERFATLSALVERYLRQQGPHELRALARTERSGLVSHSVRAHFSREHGVPYLLLEARQGAHVLRAVYLFQQHLAPLPRVELRAGEPGLEQAVAQALRHRAPVLLTGELPPSEVQR